MIRPVPFNMAGLARPSTGFDWGCDQVHSVLSSAGNNTLHLLDANFFL